MGVLSALPFPLLFSITDLFVCTATARSQASLIASEEAQAEGRNGPDSFSSTVSNSEILEMDRIVELI